MEDLDVLGNEAITPGVADKAQGDKDGNVSISRAELEGLRRDRDEARQSERDWANMARRGGGREAEPRVTETETRLDPNAFVEAGEDGLADDSPEKLVDDLAAQGTKALAARGYVTRKEAERLAVGTAERVTRELIGQERQKMGTDAQFASDFPELRACMNDPQKQKDSALWQETAKIYQKAAAMDPGALKTPAALYLAAEAATERLKARAPRAGNEQGEEPEEDRRQRSASQDGRTRTRVATVDDDMMGAQAKQLAKAFGVTEAEYKASREEVRGNRRR